LIGVHLQGEFWIDIAAVIAGGVGKFVAAALGAADIMNGLERLMRPAFALAGFTVSLNGKQGCLTPDAYAMRD